MPLYEFECECGRRTESFCSVGTTRTPCSCGQLAQKILSRPCIKIPYRHRAVNSTEPDEHGKWMQDHAAEIKAGLDNGTLIERKVKDLV